MLELGPAEIPNRNHQTPSIVSSVAQRFEPLGSALTPQADWSSVIAESVRSRCLLSTERVRARWRGPPGERGARGSHGRQSAPVVHRVARHAVRQAVESRLYRNQARL